MAAPMTPAAPTRSQEIIAKENAIKKRLAKSNEDAKVAAGKNMNKKLAILKKRKQTGVVSSSYNTQSILGANKGFAKSDYGVGAGAAIPYQIGTEKQSVIGSNKLPDIRRPPKKKGPPDWVNKAKDKAKADAIVRRASQSPKTKPL